VHLAMIIQYPYELGYTLRRCPSLNS
jgi:hypothetical protein